MRIGHSLIGCAAVLVVSMSGSYAGPCSQDIDRLQAEIDAQLDSNASAGSYAPESGAATMHRQPTPGSIQAAESRLGEVSPEKAQAITAGMARAREADRAGDQIACEQPWPTCIALVVSSCR